MIWQLMKLDVAWHFVKRQAVLFIALAAIWHFFVGKTNDPTATIVLMVGAPLFSLGITPLVQPGDTRYQAALPVTVRQAFAARMLSALALQWLPVAAGAMILIVLRDAGAGMPLRTWSLATCIVSGIQCAAIRGLKTRGALALVAMPVSLFILNLIAVAVAWPWRNTFVWNLAIICCWLVCAGMVAWTWRIAPESLPLAPTESSSAGPRAVVAERAGSRGTPWRPVLSTLFLFLGFEYVIYFLAMCAMHSALIAYVLVVQGQDWKSTRMLSRWIMALPVPPSVMLTTTVLPGMLSLICGYLVGVHLLFVPFRGTDTGLRTQIVTVALIAGWSMLANLLALTGDGHSVRRLLPSGYRPAVLRLSLMGAGLGLILWQMTATHLDPVLWLSSTLPSSLGGLVGMLVLTVVGLWWALYAMFRQVEFIDQPTGGRS